MDRGHSHPPGRRARPACIANASSLPRCVGCPCWTLLRVGASPACRCRPPRSSRRWLVCDAARGASSAAVVVLSVRGVVIQHATGEEERPAVAAAGEGGAMRIAVYGAGGVGGYFGGRLAQAGADVHLIARGAHLQALREHGLSVRSVKGDFEVQAPATDDPADVGPCDFVLLCVKTFDTDAAAA